MLSDYQIRQKLQVYEANIIALNAHSDFIDKTVFEQYRNKDDLTYNQTVDVVIQTPKMMYSLTRDSDGNVVIEDLTDDSTIYCSCTKSTILSNGMTINSIRFEIVVSDYIMMGDDEWIIVKENFHNNEGVVIRYNQTSGVLSFDPDSDLKSKGYSNFQVSGINYINEKHMKVESKDKLALESYVNEKIKKALAASNMMVMSNSNAMPSGVVTSNMLSSDMISSDMMHAGKVSGGMISSDPLPGDIVYNGEPVVLDDLEDVSVTPFVLRSGPKVIQISNPSDYHVGDVVLKDGTKLDIDAPLTYRIWTSIAGKVVKVGDDYVEYE